MSKNGNPNGNGQHVTGSPRIVATAAPTANVEKADLTINTPEALQALQNAEILQRQDNKVNLLKKALDGYSELTTNFGPTDFVRGAAFNFLLDGPKDIDAECGYPPWLMPQQYNYMYDREAIARRVVDCLPEETWSMDPEIWEDDDPDKETPFEAGWAALEEQHNLFSMIQRADVLSGIGQFGIILIGIDDGKDLREPVDGIFDDGTVAPETAHKLLFLRVFSEVVVFVKVREIDITSPRYSQPKIYTIQFRDYPNWGVQAGEIIARDIHWTRVIHLADNRKESEVYGIPRMQPVYNRLYDLRKVYASSGEGYWKGAFPGLAFEVNPEVAAQGVELDVKSIREEMERFQNGLQRYLALTGVTTKSLPATMMEPGGCVETHLRAIAICLGIPERILWGSEEAVLAGNQDSRAWNKRLGKRQTKYVNPLIIRPFINRLIAMGILPPPKDCMEPVEGEGTFIITGGYQIEWPDLNAPTDMDKAQVAAAETSAMAAYVQGGVSQLMAPREYLTHVLGYSVEEADAILEASMEFSGDEEEPLSAASQAAQEQEAAEQEHDQAMEMQDAKAKGGKGENTKPERNSALAANVDKDREFSSTQIQLHPSIADRIKAMGLQIPDSELANDGRETDPHVTVKYGLHTNDPNDVSTLLQHEPAIRYKLGKTSLFPASGDRDYEVVKVDVDSPDLHRLNGKISTLDHTDTYPEYKPHATVAYVKAGMGKKYEGLDDCEGLHGVCDHVIFSGKEKDSKTPIQLVANAAGLLANADSANSILHNPSKKELEGLLGRAYQKHGAYGQKFENKDGIVLRGVLGENGDHNWGSAHVYEHESVRKGKWAGRHAGQGEAPTGHPQPEIENHGRTNLFALASGRIVRQDPRFPSHEVPGIGSKLESVRAVTENAQQIDKDFILHNPDKGKLQAFFDTVAHRTTPNDPLRKGNARTGEYVLRGLHDKATGEHRWADANHFEHGELMFGRHYGGGQLAPELVTSKEGALSVKSNGQIMRQSVEGEDVPHSVPGIGSKLKPAGKFVANAAISKKTILHNPSKPELQGFLDTIHHLGREDPNRYVPGPIDQGETVLRGIEHKETGDHHWGSAEEYDHRDLIEKVDKKKYSPRDWAYNKDIAKQAGYRRLFATARGEIHTHNEGGEEGGVGGMRRYAMKAMGDLEPVRLVRNSDEWKKINHGDEVDGLETGHKIPNRSSIGSSFNNYEVKGLHEVPMSAMEVTAPHELFYAKNDVDHSHRLAAQIRKSGRIDPLIVAKDKKGPYVLEGGHRLGALHLLGKKSFPALVVHDHDDSAGMETNTQWQDGWKVNPVQDKQERLARGVLTNPSKGDLQTLLDTVHQHNQEKDISYSPLKIVLRGVSNDDGTKHNWGSSYYHEHHDLKQGDMSLKNHLYVSTSGHIAKMGRMGGFEPFNVPGIGPRLQKVQSVVANDGGEDSPYHTIEHFGPGEGPNMPIATHDKDAAYTLGLTYARLALQDHRNKPRSHLFVARNHEGNLIGALHMNEEGGQYKVSYAGHNGEQKGVGQNLMKHALQFAESRQKPMSWISTERSSKLYRRAGVPEVSSPTSSPGFRAQPEHITKILDKGSRITFGQKHYPSESLKMNQEEANV